MKAPEPLVVVLIPSVNVPVCVVTSVVSVCVFTSVAKCVLRYAHSVGARACVRGTACVREAPRVEETACVREAPRVEETACVSNMVCMSETPCASGRPCVSGTTCASEMARVSERPCVRETACVRSLYVREMTVGMREHATTCPSVMTWCVSVVTRRSVCVECRRRRRQMRDRGRVAAVVISKTAPGLHGNEREVRAVLRKRPPRVQLRE